jgi:hypothetical protein
MIESTSGGGLVFTGQHVYAYQALTIRAALKLAAVGVKVNRHATKSNLLLAASRLTGKRYRHKDLEQARYDLARFAGLEPSQQKESNQ